MHLYGTTLYEQSTLTVLHVMSLSEIDTSHWQKGGE